MGIDGDTPIPVSDDDDVIYQGDFYDEGNGAKTAMKQDTKSEKKVGQVIAEDNKDVKPPSKSSALDLLGDKKHIVIVGGISLILLLIVGMAWSSSSKKAKDAEEQARLEQMLQEAEEYKFEYDEFEIAELRKQGYTGDEIEQYELDEIPAADLIEMAESERAAMLEAEIAPYFDSASEEFWELYRHTWVGQDELIFDTNTMQYTYHETTMNVDYKKLPARGHQLFIEYYLSNGDTCFMLVSPERYVQLDAEGNMLLKVQYTKTADGAKIITGATEIIPE